MPQHAVPSVARRAPSAKAAPAGDSWPKRVLVWRAARRRAGHRHWRAALRSALRLWLTMTGGLLLVQILVRHSLSGFGTILEGELLAAAGMLVLVALIWLFGI